MYGYVRNTCMHILIQNASTFKGIMRYQNGLEFACEFVNDKALAVADPKDVSEAVISAALLRAARL